MPLTWWGRQSLKFGDLVFAQEKNGVGCQSQGLFVVIACLNQRQSVSLFFPNPKPRSQTPCLFTVARSLTRARSFLRSHLLLVSFDLATRGTQMLLNVSTRAAQDIVLVSCRLLVSKKYEARAAAFEMTRRYLAVACEGAFGCIVRSSGDP